MISGESSENTARGLGFGAYRIRDGSETHLAALKLALKSGVRIIDTSPTYGDGSSERLVGRALKEFDQASSVRIITKVGCIQGQALAEAKLRAERDEGFPSTVRYQEDFWYSISPEFLSWQIGESLKRLGRIDCLMIHNPEYYLRTEPNLSEHYRRLREAFLYLEDEVEAGRIGAYGLSSNTLAPEQDSPESTSLETLLEIKQALGPHRALKAIEFPFNLYESEGVTAKNSRGLSVLELACEGGLEVFTNRPFNVMSGRGLLRLTSFPAHNGFDVEGALHASITRVLELEDKAPEQKIVSPENLAWGRVLSDNLNRLSDIVTWTETLEGRIGPKFENAIAILSHEPRLSAWSTEYSFAVWKLFESFTKLLEARSSAQSRTLAAELNKHCPELKGSPTLSQKVMRIYRSISGYRLAGMRRPEYVQDLLSAGPPLEPRVAMALIEHFRLVRPW